MLISCPECDNRISDKAISCPICGFPMKEVNTSLPMEIKPLKKAYKHPKLPNGFGTIRKLSGKRRKPYAAYLPRMRNDYDDNGNLIKAKPLGYYKTYGDAYRELSLWNTTGRKEVLSPTFAELFDKWFDKECKDLPSSNSKVQGYKASYKYCEDLYEMPITTIYADHIQNAIDDCPKGYSTKVKIKQLVSKIFQYAIMNGICTTNYATFTSAGTNDNKNGTPLTEDEIKRLWKNSENKDVQICLIYLYSGYRLTELKVCEIDLNEMLFIGGLKTTKGRERIVPIHSAIKQFVADFDQKNFNPKAWRESQFSKVKELCKIENAPDGENRTIHDFRHTFSWLCDHYQVDAMAKALIMGHSLGSNVESTVYGHRTVDELKQEIEKIKIYLS